MGSTHSRSKHLYGVEEPVEAFSTHIAASLFLFPTATVLVLIVYCYEDTPICANIMYLDVGSQTTL